MKNKTRFRKLVISVARRALKILEHWQHRARMRAIPPARILLGDENGIEAAEYARLIGNPLWPSTPLIESPYVKLIQRYSQIGDTIFDPRVFGETAYYQNALQCLRATGSYYEATCVAEVCKMARKFLEWSRAEMVAGNGASLSQGWHLKRHPPWVRPILHSDCFQIVEGHPQLAIASIKGERILRVFCEAQRVLTPLQELILKVAWTGGRRELYQPIDSPEFGAEWVLVRRCTDRFAMMRDFLRNNGLMPPKCQTYLDIASCYGFFIAQMSKLGFRAYGVEHDPTAVCIGQTAYGLRPEQLVRADCVRFLQEQAYPYDVTSCFSLLHHFIRAKKDIPANELMRLIDNRTKYVLFLDTGQNAEDLYQKSLHLWDPDYIEKWIMENSSFSRVYRLGTDQDRVYPFDKRFSRTLFACVRY